MHQTIYTKEGHTTEPTNPLNPYQLWLDTFDPVLRLNSAGELYANPRASAALDGTAQSKTDWLIYDQLSDNEIALRWVPKLDHAVKIRRPKRGSTLSFSARPLLLLRPALRVPDHRIRIIPYQIRHTDGGPLFILDLSEQANIPSRR